VAITLFDDPRRRDAILPLAACLHAEVEAGRPLVPGGLAGLFARVRL